MKLGTYPRIFYEPLPIRSGRGAFSVSCCSADILVSFGRGRLGRKGSQIFDEKTKTRPPMVRHGHMKHVCKRSGFIS